MTSLSSMKRLFIGMFVLLMAVAIWSRVATLKEGPQIIRNGTEALSRLFRGVLK